MLQKQHFLKFPVLTGLIYPSHAAKPRGFSMCWYKGGGKV